MAMRAAAVMEMGELVEEFLLRLPPDDPASLVRAALVCKPWRRILGSRGFRRRFRDFHRKRRLLGVIHCSGRAAPRFAPTSSFRPRNFHQFRYVHDSHHGRVLSVLEFGLSDIIVWDPITGEKQLPRLQLPQEPSNVIDMLGWNAAVLCACSRNSSSDHLDCDGRHFLVVYVGSSPHHGVYVYVYSSETGSWVLTASAAQHPVDPFCVDENVRGTLAGSALHFLVQYKRRKTRICKYNVDTQEISWIKLPPSCSYQSAGCRVLLTSTHDGGLGCARLENSRLYLWSREAGSDGLLEWVHTRVIEVETMLPSINRYGYVATFVDGIGVGAFLVTTPDGLFSIDLDSNQVTKVCEDRGISYVVPYMSLCNPARGTAFIGEEQSVGA